MSNAPGAKNVMSAVYAAVVIPVQVAVQVLNVKTAGTAVYTIVVIIVYVQSIRGLVTDHIAPDAVSA